MYVFIASVLLLFCVFSDMINNSVNRPVFVRVRRYKITNSLFFPEAPVANLINILSTLSGMPYFSRLTETRSIFPPSGGAIFETLTRTRRVGGNLR